MHDAMIILNYYYFRYIHACIMQYKNKYVFHIVIYIKNQLNQISSVHFNNIKYIVSFIVLYEISYCIICFTHNYNMAPYTIIYLIIIIIINNERVRFFL